MDTVMPQTSNEISEWISAAALKIEDKVIAWRRDIHQNPELSYNEKRTAALVAEHLKKLGIEGECTASATPGRVVGILKGGKPGGVVALRADMDALPVRVEQPGRPCPSRFQGCGRQAVDVGKAWPAVMHRLAAMIATSRS